MSTVRHTARVLAALLGFSALALYPQPLDAQYFGRNQVQYRTFDFEILKTEHFDLYYYPAAGQGVDDVARMAERWYDRFSTLLSHELSDRQPLILYATHPDFQQNNITGDLGEGVQGVTEVFKQRIVMPFMHSLAETDHLVGHELVHAFQYDISGLGRAQGGLEAAARRYQVPLWFSEGMAQYLSVGPVDPHATIWLRDAALTGTVPTIEQMTRSPRFNPYRWGHAFWAYVGGRWGDAAIGQILRQVGEGVPYPEAFQRILNAPLDEISEEWQIAIRRTYLPLLAERKETREIADPLITLTRDGGRANLGPSLSPNGKYLAFLSELDNLDIELYVADAESGKVIRRLVRSSTFDPHFGSLRYISSSGTWSPDGKQFAFSALREGSDKLVILDVEDADILREYEIGGVFEITNPTWSPDGNSIVFSGLKGGYTDLYMLDLETGSTQQLTDDAYAQLHPAFSPDGETIAFTTDQGPGTELEDLQFGGFQIALLDLRTNAVRLAPGMQGRRNINPSWTSDGSGLFFVSNRIGIPNVYRLDLSTEQVFRVTDVFSGITGITDLSPTITTSRGSDQLVFSAYERGGWNIYKLTDSQRLAGTELTTEEVAIADTTVPLPAVMPPVPRPQEPAFNRVALYLHNAERGLPSLAVQDTYPVKSYTPRLILDYLGQPQVGVSTGGVYNRGGLYGGINSIFSDQLGRHTVYGAIQAQGQLDEIGFAGIYLYRRNRWNYGASAQRIPYVAVFRQYTQDQIDGVPVLQEEYVRYRYFDSSLQGVAQYPFSRVQRAEFSGGLRRMSFDQQVFARVFEGQSGRYLGVREFDRDGESYNFAETSAALVYDNALFGYTSPFAGQRYRFEVSPTLGDIQYVQALADYRRYFFLRPFTFALRGYHLGRYGRDAELFRQFPLGHTYFIRGYDRSDMLDECFNSQDPGADVCGVLQQTSGSRIGVANAELRFPLVRQLVLGFLPVGFPPIEGFAFFDAGVAWDNVSRPVFASGLQLNPEEHGILTSGGFGARVNLLGYLILEVDYVKAFERDIGWHWQFAIQPGF